ncbi:hypothetical protein B0H21DRAFT_886642 [Amylocystis lapponica]|nr:hypothetical protein B0H21DRAFT_886642 [Amylocystis lapponica]
MALDTAESFEQLGAAIQYSDYPPSRPPSQLKLSSMATATLSSTVATSSSVSAPEIHRRPLSANALGPSSSLDAILVSSPRSAPPDALTSVNSTSEILSANNNPDPDPQILEALRSKDRLFVLKLGEMMESLITERRTRLDLTPTTSYQRLLVHRCSAYYKLAPEADNAAKTICVYFRAESSIPPRRLCELVPPEESAQPAFKIMRRSATENSRGRHNSQAGSVTGDDADFSDPEPSEAGSISGRSNVTGGSNKRFMTLEQREAAYNEARSRIFMDFEEKEKEKEKDMSANSSTFSLVSGSGSTSGGRGSSVGDLDDSGSSAPTESEWSGPVARTQRDGRRGGSAGSSSRSLRSSGASYEATGSGSSRDSRATSPSFTYASLYEPPPAIDPSQYFPPPPPPGYMAHYMYPPYPPGHGQMHGQPYLAPYPYYPPYGYQPSQHHSDPASPAAVSAIIYAHQPFNPYQVPAYGAPPGMFQPGMGTPLSTIPSPSSYMSEMPGTNTFGSTNGHGNGNGAESHNHSRASSRSSGSHHGGSSKRGAAQRRGAWSLGPGASTGGYPHSVGNLGGALGNNEVVGPRFGSGIRRISGTSSGSGSGARTPGDEASSTASSSTNSSASHQTFTSTSSKHPLPARPDWAVGLRPQPMLHPPRHHDHSGPGSRTMSPARIGGQAHLPPSHPPQPVLQSQDFPPLSSAPERRPPVVAGAWTNPSSTRSIMTPGPSNPHASALVHYPTSNPQLPGATNAPTRVDDQDAAFERTTAEGNAELFNPKRARATTPGSAQSEKGEARARSVGETIASATLVEQVGAMALDDRGAEESEGCPEEAQPSPLAPSPPEELRTAAMVAPRSLRPPRVASLSRSFVAGDRREFIRHNHVHVSRTDGLMLGIGWAQRVHRLNQCLNDERGLFLPPGEVGDQYSENLEGGSPSSARSERLRSSWRDAILRTPGRSANRTMPSDLVWTCSCWSGQRGQIVGCVGEPQVGQGVWWEDYCETVEAGTAFEARAGADCGARAAVSRRGADDDRGGCACEERGGILLGFSAPDILRAVRDIARHIRVVVVAPLRSSSTDAVLRRQGYDDLGDRRRVQVRRDERGAVHRAELRSEALKLGHRLAEVGGEQGRARGAHAAVRERGREGRGERVGVGIGIEVSLFDYGGYGGASLCRGHCWGMSIGICGGATLASLRGRGIALLCIGICESGACNVDRWWHRRKEDGILGCAAGRMIAGHGSEVFRAPDVTTGWEKSVRYDAPSAMTSPRSRTILKHPGVTCVGSEEHDGMWPGQRTCCLAKRRYECPGGPVHARHIVLRYIVSAISTYTQKPRSRLNAGIVREGLDRESADDVANSLYAGVDEIDQADGRMWMSIMFDRLYRKDGRGGYEESAHVTHVPEVPSDIRVGHRDCAGRGEQTGVQENGSSEEDEEDGQPEMGEEVALEHLEVAHCAASDGHNRYVLASRHMSMEDFRIGTAYDRHRFLSLGSRKSKKKQKAAQLQSSAKVDSEGRLVPHDNQDKQSDAEANRLLRTASARFAVVSEIDYANLPPLPHPINHLTPTPTLTPTPSATSLQRSGTYVVKVHERQLLSCTEFPNANPPMPSRDDPITPPHDRDGKNDQPRPLLKEVLFTPRDQSRLGTCAVTRLSQACSTWHEQRKRTGSTLRQLLGNPEGEFPQGNNVTEGDISWAERYLEERFDATSPLSSTSSLALETPTDALFPNDHSERHHSLFSALEHELSSNYPFISSMEVELSGANDSEDLQSSLRNVIYMSSNPHTVLEPKTPQRAAEIFGFLTERRKSLHERSSSVPPLSTTSLALTSDPETSSPTHTLTASTTATSSPTSFDDAQSRVSHAQIRTATLTKLSTAPAILNPFSASMPFLPNTYGPPSHSHIPDRLLVDDRRSHKASTSTARSEEDNMITIPASKIPRGPRPPLAKHDFPPDLDLYRPSEPLAARPRAGATRQLSRSTGGAPALAQAPLRALSIVSAADAAKLRRSRSWRADDKENAPATPVRARTVFDTRYLRPASPASSSELSPVGREMMNNLRRERERMRAREREAGRRGSRVRES